MSSFSMPHDTVQLKSRRDPTVLGNPGLRLDLSDPIERERSLHPAVTADVDLRWLEFSVDTSAPSTTAQLVTRAFDLAVAVFGLVLLAPLMLAVAIAVWLDSNGPIFYGSERLGYQNSRFTAWKFRSMHPDAEARLDDLLRNDDSARREFATFHKLRADPRLTTVGRIIRRTSLDELPQLLNILKGEMSVVGPRPKLDRDAEVFGPALAVVLQVKPGLTGLWQVSGRNMLPVNEWVILDLEYARNRTLLGDLHICIKTFVQLWRPGRHGAY